MSTVQQSAVQLLDGGKPVSDIMFDQLEFLVDHSAHCGNSQCGECRRLVSVRQLLMKPFVEVEYRVSIRERLWDQMQWPEAPRRLKPAPAHP